VRTLLDRGLESGLDLQESRGLQEHVADCEACRAAHDRTLRFLAVLQSGPEAPVPPGFADRVIRRIQAEPPRRAGYFPSLLQVAFAAAVVVAFGITVTALGPDRMTDAFSRAYLLPAGRLQALLTRGAEFVARLPGEATLLAPLGGLLCVALLALLARTIESPAKHGGTHGR